MINDQDKFTERIFSTVREMFTVVKNQLADVPTTHEIHVNHPELQVTVPRFDSLLKNLSIKRLDKSRSMYKQRENPRRQKSYFEAIDFKIGSKHRDMTPNRLGFGVKYEGPPMSNPKEDKLAFLKGQPDVVMYFDKKAPIGSSYKENLKGLQVSEDRRA